jgi:putative acetyltransferase
MDGVRELFREYLEFLGCDLRFQGFESEIAGLPGDYAPPSGALLVAGEEGRLAGCVALRRQAEGVCEMKRLYVRPGSRGTGLGRKLAEEVIRAAREAGYGLMRLDTLDRLEAAMRLYETLGFHRTEPYYPNPLEGVVYWELDLSGGLYSPGVRA